MAVADFLDGRGDDGGVVLGVVKFEMHTAAYVLQLEHGASPGGAGDGDLNRIRTEFGVAGNHGVTAAEKHGGIAVMHGLDVEHGGWRKIVEKDSTFDLGLDDGVVNVISEVGVRNEHSKLPDLE